MNRTIARALLEDAFRQVMDNKVFRLLLLISLVLVAPWYLVGFREDGVRLLYGWKTIPWSDVFGMVGQPVPQGGDVHVQFVQKLQMILVQSLAGNLGILFCIAATAFFVPRMLEKGAADTLFTKPIPRFALLAARYAAGLLFVGILSLILVVGIHVGLLLFSGYSDPGFLWNALTLVYIYALVQTVSITVGVFTRSSVASILCTIVFFAFNGCVQSAWVASEWVRERHRAAEDDATAAAQRAALSENPVLNFIKVGLNACHYALPKTNDADVLTRKLRTVVAGRGYVLRDDAIKLVVDEEPDGFKRTSDDGSVDLARAPAKWVGDGGSEIELSRRSRTSENGSSSRKFRQSTSQAAIELVKSLEHAPDVEGAPERDSPDSMPLLCEIVRWTERSPNGTVSRQHAFIAVEDWMLELDVRQPGVAQDPRSRFLAFRFMRGMHVLQDDVRFLGQAEWYDNRFGWSSPLRYNAIFSLLSSLAFAALLLGISGWRLSRIDF